MVLLRSGVRRVPGGVRVRLSPDERDLLRTLPESLRGALTGEAGPDELLSRLFPPAYADADKEAEFHLTRGGELSVQRSQTLDRFQATFASGTEHRGHWTVDLDWDDAHAWLQVVNDTRLTLATIEGIRTESDWHAEIETPPRLLLHWLGWFEEQLVSALMSTLDE